MTFSCKAIIVHQGKLLLLLDDKYVDGELVPCWDLPGGKQENGETPEQTVIREVKEETSLDVVVEKELMQIQISTRAGIKKCILFFCNSESNTVDLTKNPALGEHIKEYRWVAHHEIENLEMRPEIQNFLLEYLW